MLPNRRLLFVAALLCAVVAFPLAASASSPVAVSVALDSGCVLGVGPANKDFIATLRTAPPRVRARDRVRGTTEPDGFFFFCFALSINGGDSITLEFPSKVKIIEVPRLLPVTDRVANTMRGSAPPHAEVHVMVAHRKGFKTTEEFQFVVNADGAGDWQLDTTGTVNLKGFDGLTITTDDGTNQFAALTFVPGMAVTHADNNLVLTANRGQVLVELTNRHGTVKGRATAGHFIFGIFTASLFDDDHSAAYPLGRDVVTANIADDARLVMPISKLRGKSSTDMIWGRCPPNARYELDVVDIDTFTFEVFYGKADVNGDIVRNVGNRINLKRGNELTLRCLYPSGDEWLDRDIAS